MAGKQGMGRQMFVLLAGAIIITAAEGCIGVAHSITNYITRGELRDADSADPLVRTRIELTVESGDTAFDPAMDQTSSQGEFELFVMTGFGSVVVAWPGIRLSRFQATPALVPDRVILLIGEGDEQVEVMIELTEEMIGEPSEFGDRTIELGTILVPGGDA